MTDLRRDTLFVGLSRPQMFAGVSYTFFVINSVVAAELFIISKSLLVLTVPLIAHGIGALISLEEPRAVDLWLAKSRFCPRIKNYRFWQCNSYRA